MLFVKNVEERWNYTELSFGIKWKDINMVINEIKSTMRFIEEITSELGNPIASNNYYIEDLGCPHIQPKLPKGYSAVYIFVYENGNEYEFLKIGKANSKSAARFNYQHYGFSVPSTLAKSLCSDEEFKSKGINEDNVKNWMLNNLHRINILLDSTCGKAATELVESVFHYKFRPRFEGNI